MRSFNLPVEDMKRAVDFYSSVFGWSLEAIHGSGGDYHHAVTAKADEEGIPLSRGAINGGLFKKGTHGINIPFMELEVDSIDESVIKVLNNGGRIVREKRPMMEFAFYAIIQDPDGNFLGLMEYRK